MELTESKIKCLINEENLSKINEETLDEILKIALSHVYGKTDTEGKKFSLILQKVKNNYILSHLVCFKK